MTIDNWPKHIQKYLFLLKDGFFEFPYLFNSPEVMLDSIIKLPITDHVPSKQSIYLNTPLYEATMRYRKIEEGFWLLATDMDVRENIIAKSGYDNNQSSDYYLLTFSVFEYKFPFKDSDDVRLLSTCWTFSKPETEVTTYFYKGTTGKFFSFAINKKWADQNLSSKKIPQRKAIKKFLNGKKGSYTWLNIAPKAHDLAKKITKNLEPECEGGFDSVNFKKDCMKLIIEFFDNSFEDNRILDNVSLSNLDYYNVAKAEKMILHNLHLPFVGIGCIAKDVNTSPTKLKSNFKAVFGFSMLQYHKEKNMLLAMQLIQNSDIHIQNIATVTGYDCAGRFASKFKKRFGKLPSEVRFLFTSNAFIPIIFTLNNYFSDFNHLF
ncbi:AraC family transcriptional regulator [Flavobacterium rhamnosiphilum]|uniref:AraC family transcriptional regulator n=1 Tax=Flavobacterium rhamnosiphilum TaxID=2541724 RepID=A0A4R5F3N9_9FLAO|nr:AraC family transcriptional regulator [Flavobacterium rhamnosiphilum]TDE42161.1 AraC family transcriptional regulator [Flavobacterium rhamnosiphilum]